MDSAAREYPLPTVGVLGAPAKEDAIAADDYHRASDTGKGLAAHVEALMPVVVNGFRQRIASLSIMPSRCPLAGLRKTMLVGIIGSFLSQYLTQRPGSWT
jgi:hypothetical protein